MCIALSHFHAAVSIDLDDVTDDKHLKNPHTIELCDLSNNSDVNPCALKKAHIKEAQACHEEAQRQQRMCRELKVISSVYLSFITGKS